MRNEPMRRNELPETCFSILPSSGQLIIIRCGERGYYPSEWDTGNREENREIASSHNVRRGITDIQEAAMLAGSMFGWNTPGANPQWYLDNARYVNSNIVQGHIKDPIMCQTMLSPEATQIGSYRGLTLELSFDTFAREYRLTMIGQLRHTVTLGTDVFGNLQRMDNALEGLPIKEQTCREQLSNLQTQLETAKAEVQKPFPREAELMTKTARLEELNSLLNLDHKEPEIVDAEPDEDQRLPERRRPQLER